MISCRTWHAAAAIGRRFSAWNPAACYPPEDPRRAGHTQVPFLTGPVLVTGASGFVDGPVCTAAVKAHDTSTESPSRHADAWSFEFPVEPSSGEARMTCWTNTHLDTQ